MHQQTYQSQTNFNLYQNPPTNSQAISTDPFGH